MANWQDVLDARGHATDVLAEVWDYGERTEEAGSDVAPLGTMLAARAVCAELRALSVTINYAAQEIVDALRFSR